LLEALISEVNLLLHRVRRTSRHNHTLLSRAVEIHQDTLQHLRPQSFTKTYSPAGRLAVATARPPSTLRAAG
jgi:flagellar biosynthesis/type III secretory pathway chaperone